MGMSARVRSRRWFLAGDAAAIASLALLLGVGCGGRDGTLLDLGAIEPGVSGAGAATGAGAGASGVRPGSGPDGASSGSTGAGVGGQGSGTGATGAGAANPGAGGAGA